MKKIRIMLFAGALSLILIASMLIASCGKKPDTTGTQNQPDAKKNNAGFENMNLPDTFITAGYMYWTPPGILDEQWSAVIIGEIAGTEKQKGKVTDTTKNEVMGIVKIEKVLLSAPVGSKNMEKEKYIRTDALKGFNQGDKVLIYFVKYKDGYAIKRNNIQKITGQGDELVEMTERFIKNGQNTEFILKDPAEYRLWGKYDKNTVSLLMQKFEDKEKGK